MFGKKKKKKNIPKEQFGNVDVIPDIFYGGKDPTIYRNSSSSGLKKNTDTKIDTKKEKSNDEKSPHSFSELFKSKKFLIVSGVIIFLVVTALISWYYIDQALRESRPTQEVDNPTQIEEEKVVREEVVEQEEDAEEVVEEVEEETEVEIDPESEDLEVEKEEVGEVDQEISTVTPMVFPDVILVDGPDIDGDKLTDLEEELYGSDSGVWDTDKDGYYDGQEVFNLYNPGGNAPVKLIDSGFVNEYINPFWQYRLYSPIAWDVGGVDPEQKQVLFSSIGGDYIEVRVAQKEVSQSFPQWFAENSKDQLFQELVQFSNGFEEDGYRRTDHLVAYFPRQKAVYILIYHPGLGDSIDYRQTMQMMVESFRPSKTNVQIPEQPVIPKPPEVENSDSENISGEIEEGVEGEFSDEVVTSTATSTS